MKRGRGIWTSAPKASLRSFELPFNWFGLIAAYCGDILCSACCCCCCRRVALSVCGKHKHAMPIWQEGEGGKEEGCNCSWVHVYPLLNHLSAWRAADTRRRLAKSEKLCHVCLLRLQLGTCNCNCHCHCKLLLSHSLPTFSLFLTRTLGVYLFIQRSEFYFISVYFHKKLLLFFHFRTKQTDEQKIHLKKRVNIQKCTLKKREWTYKNALKKKHWKKSYKYFARKRRKNATVTIKSFYTHMHALHTHTYSRTHTRKHIALHFCYLFCHFRRQNSNKKRRWSNA